MIIGQERHLGLGFERKFGIELGEHCDDFDRSKL